MTLVLSLGSEDALTARLREIPYIFSILSTLGYCFKEIPFAKFSHNLKGVPSSAGCDDRCRLSASVICKLLFHQLRASRRDLFLVRVVIVPPALNPTTTLSSLCIVLVLDCTMNYRVYYNYHFHV